MYAQRATDTTGGISTRFIDMRPRKIKRVNTVPEAWYHEAAGDIYGTAVMLVTHGPIFWGTILVNPDWINFTSVEALGTAPENVTIPTVTGYRWLYAACDLSLSGYAGSVVCSFTDEDTPPHDDGFTLKRVLSYWKITTAGAFTKAYQQFLAGPPFPGNVASTFAPPRG